MSQTAPYLFQEEIYSVPASTIVVVAREWHTLPDDEKALLSKILSSVRVNVASVSIRCYSSVSLELLKIHSPSKVLVFGSKVHPEVKSYEFVQWADFSIIRADDFPLLDDARKKSLWQALRQMFGV